MQQLYRNDAEFSVSARMIPSLAFVPVDDIIDSFVELANALPDELQPILDYFEDTYIGPMRRGRRRAPMFSPTMWSTYARVVANLPLTNNSVEGWHTTLAANAGGHHINFWRYINVLKRQEALASVQRTHIDQGRQTPTMRPVTNLVGRYAVSP